ncbi:MAG: hypothetical protein GYB33_13815 [Gammaproteobacteria bacterium]|nr:hypothetical protein [Gammaproteobacteria bacterium]
MKSALLHNEDLVWVALIAVTITSWFLFEKMEAVAAVYTIILISGLKVGAIGVGYMEANRANRLFRYFFSAWCVGVTVVIALFRLLQH